MEHHPGGRYSLCYRTPEGNRVWQAVGNDPDQALTSKIQREHIHQGAKLGIRPYPDVPTDRSLILISPSEASEVALANRKRMDASVDHWINEVSIRKSWKTGSAYRATMIEVQLSCRKTFVDEIDRGDVTAFSFKISSQGQCTQNRVQPSFLPQVLSPLGRLLGCDPRQRHAALHGEDSLQPTTRARCGQ